MKTFDANRKDNLLVVTDANTGEIVDEIEISNVYEGMSDGEILEDNDYVYCYDCGKLVYESYTSEVCGHRVCEYCLNDYYSWCDCCEEYVDRDEIEAVRVRGGTEYWCERCREGDAFWCPGCETWYDAIWYSSYEGDDGECYCEDCIDDHTRGDSVYLDDYHTFKCGGNFEFCHSEGENRKNTLHMGAEIEVCGDGDSYSEREDCLEESYNTFGNFFHYESDGSLSDDGWENISQPATLSYWEKMLPEMKEVYKTFVSKGFTSHNNGMCGLHIHLDKKFFGNKVDSSTAKLMWLFCRDWDNLVKFSRRKKSEAEHWAANSKSPNNYPNKSCASLVKENKSYCCITRYLAVNITNKNTIEIRLWRGTLNTDTILATLKFTNRLAEICKNKSAVEISKMSFEDLLGDDPDILTYWDKVKDRTI